MSDGGKETKDERAPDMNSPAFEPRGGHSIWYLGTPRTKNNEKG